METGSHGGKPRDGCPLAQVWIRTVLACHFQGSSDRREKEDFEGSKGSDLSDGRREFELGRAAHPRRVIDARFRRLRKNCLPLDDTSAEGPGASETVACVSTESSGSHRGDGLLHSSNDYFQPALLFLRHQPRPSADSALQRHETSNKPLDRSAAPRSVSV